MHNDASSCCQQPGMGAAEGGVAQAAEVEPSALFLSPSPMSASQPSEELLRAFTDASIKSGCTLEWSASGDGQSMLQAPFGAAGGLGSSCPVDPQACVLKTYMDRLTGSDGLLLGKYR